MTRQCLMDNVYLTYVPSEKFKTSFMSAQMVVPMTRETTALTALLVNVLSRGTVRFPDMAAISRHLDTLYGAQMEPVVRKKGENQIFGFLASCVDDRLLPGNERVLEPLADLLGELFTAPATKNGRLNGEYLKSERDNLIDLIQSEINDKHAYASFRLMEEMCAGEAYGLRRLGSVEDVRKVSLQKLNRYYLSVLPKARLELYYCGPASQERVAGMFRRAFSALPRYGEMEILSPVRKDAPEICRLVEETMDVAQGKLCIGFRNSSKDSAATMLMNAMFGGASKSKLYMNVREKLSLCYYAGSSNHWKKGIITVSAGIDSRNYQLAKDEILAQLDALKNGDWEQWELDSARSALRSSFRTIEDSAGAMEDFIMGQIATNGEETLPGLLAAIEEVTPDRIRSAAACVKPDTIYFLRGKEGQE